MIGLIPCSETITLVFMSCGKKASAPSTRMTFPRSWHVSKSQQAMALTIGVGSSLRDILSFFQITVFTDFWLQTYRDSIRKLKILSEGEIQQIFGPIDSLVPIHEGKLYLLTNVTLKISLIMCLATYSDFVFVLLLENILKDKILSIWDNYIFTLYVKQHWT